MNGFPLKTRVIPRRPEHIVPVPIYMHMSIYLVIYVEGTLGCKEHIELRETAFTSSGESCLPAAGNLTGFTPVKARISCFFSCFSRGLSIPIHSVSPLPTEPNQ